MRILERLDTGLTVVNTIWLTTILVRLVSRTEMLIGRFWIGLVLFLVVVSILSYSIGRLIERIETVYLKGKYLASGKFKIE